MASSLAARQATTILARLSSTKSASQAPSFLQRRGLAGAADHHGPAKVNCWSDPMSPSKWKEEHLFLSTLNTPCPGEIVCHCPSKFVIVSLSGWGLAIYGAYKFFTGGKKHDEKLVEAPQ